MRRRVASVTAAALALLAGATLARESAGWVGTWETSPVGLPATTKIGPYTIPVPTTITGTIRYRLRVSSGGRQIRLQFSNQYGDKPLELTAVSVGIAGEGLDALPQSIRPATFDGKKTIVMPAGAPVLSDPIALPVKPLGDLVVSVYVAAGISVLAWTGEPSPFDPMIVADRDATLLEHLPAGKSLSIRPILSAVSVRSEQTRAVVVALGDSITDYSIDPATGERGWPGALSRRLASKGVSVVNAGIGGNRLLESLQYMGASALSRLDQDVLSVPGLTHIVVLEGINDIGMNGPGGMFNDAPLTSAEALIAAYSQLIERGHQHRVRVLGATILPFEGAVYYSMDKERTRATVNKWIRTSKRFDGVIDFDAALRDPDHPYRLRAEYDGGDHLHPNTAGYRRMGDSIDLHLFD